MIMTSRQLTVTKRKSLKRQIRLVMRETDFLVLRRHLLQPDYLERAAVALLGKAQPGRTLELYVHRLFVPSDNDYRQQGPAVVEPRPDFVLHSFQEFSQSRLPAYLHAHSHPFCQQAHFSPIDDRYLPGMIRGLRRYIHLTDGDTSQNDPGSPVEQGRSWVRLVWGRTESGFYAECYDLDGRSLGVIPEIRIVGESGIRTLRSRTGRSSRSMAKRDRAQFDRNIRLLGDAGQQALRNTHLVICGAGGLGSCVVEYAKGLGIRRFTLIDPDRVEVSNLNRLVGATHRDIGKPKVEVMARQLHRYDPMIQIDPLQAWVQEERAHRAIGAADLIVNSLDDDGARLEVQLLAARYLKPMLDLGSGIHMREGQLRQMGGQAIWYWPGGPCLVCQGLDPAHIVPREVRELQRAIGYVRGTDETPPAVVTLNAVVAGVGMDLLARYLTGLGSVPPYVRIDLWRRQMREHRFEKRPDCPICGDAGLEGRGDEEMAILEPGRSSQTPGPGPDRISRLLERLRLKRTGREVNRNAPSF